MAEEEVRLEWVKWRWKRFLCGDCEFIKLFFVHGGRLSKKITQIFQQIRPLLVLNRN